MPSFTPPEIPKDPETGQVDPAALRRQKEARLREIEGERHPTDRPDGPSPEVGRALDPEVTER